MPLTTSVLPVLPSLCVVNTRLQVLVFRMFFRWLATYQHSEKHLQAVFVTASKTLKEQVGRGCLQMSVPSLKHWHYVTCKLGVRPVRPSNRHGALCATCRLSCLSWHPSLPPSLHTHARRLPLPSGACRPQPSQTLPTQQQLPRPTVSPPP